MHLELGYTIKVYSASSELGIGLVLSPKNGLLNSLAVACFLITDFGYFYTLNKDTNATFFVASDVGDIVFAGSAWQEIFSEKLKNTKTSENILRVTDFNKTKALLGPLKFDECYGLKLLPQLGGADAIKNLQIYKIDAYLSLLEQTVEKTFIE